MNAADAAKVAAVTAKLVGGPSDGYFEVTPQPAWKKALRRLFPRQHLDVPKEPSLLTVVHVHLDWKDRLRVLVSGHVLVETRTVTDVPVARAKSTSTVSVLAPGESA